MDDAALAAVVKMVPFSAHLGFEIKEMGPERVVVHAVIRPEFCTSGGTAHGGFLMALADFTGAVAAFQVLPEGAKGTTTIESKTNMMGPSRLEPRWWPPQRRCMLAGAPACG